METDILTTYLTSLLN